MYKLFLTLAIFSLGTRGLSAQNFVFQQKTQRYHFQSFYGSVYDDISFENTGKFQEGLCSVSNEGKWGYVNENGSIQIDLQFEQARDFQSGHAIVKKDGFFGVIDEFGETIIPFEYDNIDHFRNGTGTFMQDSIWLQMEGDFLRNDVTLTFDHPEVQALPICDCKSKMEYDRFYLNAIYNTLEYPKHARENGIEGMVVTRFLVDELGKIIDVEIIRSVDPLLDQEAIRVLLEMEIQFSPAMVDHKLVRQWKISPFKFTLE